MDDPTPPRLPHYVLVIRIHEVGVDMLLFGRLSCGRTDKKWTILLRILMVGRDETCHTGDCAETALIWCVIENNGPRTTTISIAVLGALASIWESREFGAGTRAGWEGQDDILSISLIVCLTFRPDWQTEQLLRSILTSGYPPDDVWRLPRHCSSIVRIWKWRRSNVRTGDWKNPSDIDRRCQLAISSMLQLESMRTGSLL